VLQTSPVCFVGLTSMRLSYFELYPELTYLESEMFGCTIYGSGFLRDNPWTVTSGISRPSCWRASSLTVWTRTIHSKNKRTQPPAWLQSDVITTLIHLCHIYQADMRTSLFLAAGMYMPTLKASQLTTPPWLQHRGFPTIESKHQRATGCP